MHGRIGVGPGNSMQRFFYARNRMLAAVFAAEGRATAQFRKQVDRDSKG